MTRNAPATRNQAAPAERTVPPAINLPGITGGRAGQATQVEQSRAAAEVVAAVLAAQQVPRDVEYAIAEMTRACQHPKLAEVAFYAKPQGGTTVQGPSVHLARELARCWGNVQYGVTELSQDFERGESEIMAYAWDLQTNARNSTTFIVRHARDRKRGQDPERLTQLADVYASNANVGAKRVRQAIFAVLPRWFTEDAMELCRETMRRNVDPAADIVARFSRLGVTEAQLVRHQGGKSPDQWTDADIAHLTVLGRSIHNREITKDEAFPPDPADRVQPADLTGGVDRSDEQAEMEAAEASR